ncbi:PAS domain S-box protein [Dehalococcoidia bacterium]|nr:PAS domain S-box protein [Dehalococcoidia bacterium]
MLKGEEELTKSKAYTESIIQNFLDTLIVVDAEARIQTVNPATCHLLGYTEEEIIGQPVGIIFEEEEEARRFFQFFREPEKVEPPRPQDTIRNRELTYRTRDGRLIPMLFNASVLTDEGGSVTGVVAGAKDITELKLAAAEIRREKIFSQNIVATVPDSLLVLDKDLRIKSANRTFYETFQTEPEKVIGSSITDMLRDEDGRLSAELTRLFGTGDMLENLELHYGSAILGERIFNVTARGMLVAEEEEEEEEEEELVVLQDITQRKQAERRIEHLNLVLRAIRNVNQLITREKDRDRLLKGASETLIETRGYHHAWIAILDQSGRLVTWAEAGFGESFLSFVDNLRHGELPVCIQKTLGHSDVAMYAVSSPDCAGCPLGEEHPGRKTIKTRLAHAGKVYGLLSASCPEGLEIGEEELTLFRGVADDIALALHSIELEEARRQVQKRLQESEEKHRTILENIEEGYYEVDIAGNFTFFNQSLCGILGYPPDELLGMNNRQYMDEENARKVYQTFNTVYRTGETVKAFDWEIIRKDGSKRFVEASVSLISDPDGQPTGFRGILRDITEHKQAVELYAAIVNSSQVGVCIIQDGKLQFVNPKFCERTGFSGEELLGRDSLSLVHPEDRSLVRENAVKLLKGESSLPYEFRVVTSGGKIRWVMETVCSIHHRGRRAVLGSHLDITELRQAQEALNESEEKYRGLVNNVKLGIFRSTPDPMGRFLEVNPAMEEITGYSRDELLRMNVVDLYVHPRERETTLELARLRGKTAREILFKRKEGTEITVWETKVAMKDDTGVIAYFDGILEDITERKILEQELKELYATEQRERRELEEEARARGQFINVLAHEMRTPLTPVMICAGMLRDALSSNPESTHFRLTNNILTSAQVMVSRLDDLLDLARFSSGTFTLERQELDTRDFLKKVAAEFQPVTENKGQRLVLELPETLPGIEADPSRLGQVLMNLLSNASKFSPEGRTITLRATIESTELVVEIEDQGIGISSEEQARLFEPYHRIEQDRQALPGLGLGLVISKQIVEAHGGRLWLTSELGQGSTFCFSLPVTESGV